MWCIRKYALVPFKRFYSNLSQNVINLERLNNRSLIEISGEQVWEFLQGLITNDIKHVQNGPSCMFTMMLNTKGRILYDMIVYHTHKTGSLLLECDSNAVDNVMKHISMYRVRRKVDIENLYNKLHIYTLYDSSYISYLRNFENIDPTNEFVAKGESISSTKMHKDLLIYRDPRVENLGYRIIAQSTTDVAKQVRDIWELSTSLPKVNYRWFRYNLGVGEGIADMPPGNCFPLECNCDYLHGVSFHKGCYIGQELTARTYHTGVIRKRFMPLQFTKIPTQLPADHTILHNGVVLGKIRGVEGDVALALLRVHQVLDLDEITVGNGKGKIRKPTWWPLELSKEKMTIK